MKKLVQLLGTQYIAEYFAEDVERILSEEKELDLAGAKLTPRISAILTNAIARGTVLRNTESVELDMILQENMARAILDYETKPLPLPENEDAILDTLKYLEQGVVYTLVGDNSLAFPFAVLAQLYTPHVQIDLGNQGSRFFKYITETLYRKNLQKVIETSDTYILFVGNSYFEVTITEKDTKKEFFLETTGSINWENLVAMYQVLPSYFGVVRTQKDEVLAPLWEPVIRRAMNDISAYFTNVKVTIKSFLEGEQ